MPASFVLVIYAAGSKIIRRVITADTDAELERAAQMVDGEARLDVPMADYGDIRDGNLQRAVAAIIGEPAHHGRVAEVTTDGTVAAAYAADPAIDGPIHDAGNVLELHASAVVGDAKVADAVKGSEAIFLKPAEAARAKDAIRDGALVVLDGALVSTDQAVTLDAVLGRPEPVAVIKGGA
jgi:hypothetical protein